MTDADFDSRFREHLDAMPDGDAAIVRQVHRWVDDYGLPRVLGLFEATVSLRAVAAAEAGDTDESVLWSGAKDVIENAMARLPDGV